MTEADHDSSGKAPDPEAPPATASEGDADAAVPSSASDAAPPSADVEGATAPVATSEPAAAEPVETATATTGPATAPKKGKKGRRKSKGAAAGTGSGPRSELNSEGRERPAFLLNFPHDPELEPLIVAFELGNYAHVREVAPGLAERSQQPEVKAAAHELLERIEPDPLVKFLLAIAVLLFVVVVVFVYQSHG